MTDAQTAIRELLEQRGNGKTICPSEAARVLAGSGGDWRDLMPRVHEAVDALLGEGEIALSWKGEMLGERQGPYRIARRSPRT